MKKSYLLAVVLVLSHSYGQAQDFTLVASNSNEISIQHTVDESLILPETLHYVTIDDQNYVECSTTFNVVTSELGNPMLPYFTESVILPANGNVELEVVYSHYTDYTDVLIAPSKGNLKRNIEPSAVPYLFGATYESDAFYPGNLATITDPFVLRNTRGVTVVVQPFQYNPVTKTLRVYHDLEVQVNIDESTEGINEVTARAENSSAFHDIYANFYLNTNAALGRYTPREEEGEMLIISGNSFTDEMEPFVQWKTEKGIKTTIVTKSETGPTDTDIKAYITDFYSTHPDLIFVLLVGDHDQIPSHTYGPSGGEELWSDSYYGQLTGDYYPELFVGRFSGSSVDITTMVERTLEYEKNPAEGDWMTKAIGLASNEGAGYGDDGEADWQHARNMRAKLLDFGYSEVFEFYDGSHGGEDAAGNPSAAIITPKVNAGVGLFNYTGHGAIDVCVTGNYQSSDINAATNNGKYPFVISVACNNGTFTSGTCISEVWLRAKNAGTPSGAIAAAGSTILMAWAEPMQTQDELAELISESYVSNKKTTLGGIFYNSQMSMLEDYAVSSTAREVMQTWVLFGDPSAVFRSQATTDMTVTHVASVSVGTSSVNVDCDVEDATIALVQDNIILGTSIVTGGVATFSFDPLVSESPIIVTGTKQNYATYQGEILVTANTAAINELTPVLIKTYPNPSQDFVTISWGSTTPSQVLIQNLTGKIVYQNTSPTGQSTILDVRNFAKGVYMITVTLNGTNHTSKVIVN